MKRKGVVHSRTVLRKGVGMWNLELHTDPGVVEVNNDGPWGLKRFLDQ
jgi:hypothetical protein